MLVAVILGNRINDDGNMSDIMQRRLATAIKLDKIFAPNKIILSGGAANKRAALTEAEMMRQYLVENGVDDEKLVKEDNSLTTKQNAEFSVPIAVNLGATEILLCTSNEHISRPYLNPIKLFLRQLENYPDITLQTFSE